MASNIIFLAGSSRQDSFNKCLARQAAEIGDDLGANTTFIDLADYDLPVYNGDYEQENGLPENAIKLKTMLREHDGLFIATPEYNSSISPLLKNTLDWMSRTHEDNEPLYSAYAGKVGGLAAASPGGLGGIRVLLHLRTVLATLGVTVVPAQLSVSAAHKKITDGRYVDEGTLKRLRKVIQTMISTQTP